MLSLNGNTPLAQRSQGWDANVDIIHVVAYQFDRLAPVLHTCRLQRRQLPDVQTPLLCTQQYQQLLSTTPLQQLEYT